MRVLCVENEPGAADQAADRLRADGHEVVRCFERGQPMCVGLDRPGACPLEHREGVDVALAFRAEDHGGPAAREIGVTCALRRQVPLVVAGCVRPNPFARWTSAVADGDDVDDIEEACDTAQRRSLEAIGAEVSIAVCRWLDAYYTPGIDVRTEVRRRGRALDVVVHRPPAERAHDTALAVRAHRALRDAGVPASLLSISCAD